MYQKKADKVHESETVEFEKIIADLEQEISYHQNQIVALSNLRDSTTEALDEAESEVKVVTSDIANNEASDFVTQDELLVDKHQRLGLVNTPLLLIITYFLQYYGEGCQEFCQKGVDWGKGQGQALGIIIIEN